MLRRFYWLLCSYGVHGTHRLRQGYYCPACARLAWRRNVDW